MKKPALTGIFVCAFLAAGGALAQTCTNIATGNWSNGANWTCTVLPANRVPANTDNVVIINNTTVTVDIAGAQAGSVTINGGANATALNLGGVGTSLTVTNAGGLSGNVVINAPTAAVTKQIAVGARTLTVTGSVTINGGTAGGGAANISQLTVTTSTSVNLGSLNINAGTVQSVARVTLTTGRITVGGDVTLTGGLTNANQDALLSVTGASAVGNGVIINGALNVNATLATSSTVSITAAGGRITVNGAGGVTNRDRVTVGTGIFSVTNAAATFATTNNLFAALTSVTGGTLNIAGNATVTGGTANPSGGTLTGSTGVITVGGNLSVTAGTNTNANATASVTSTGRMTVNGNVTLTGGAAAARDALLTVGGASAVGQGINIGGTLNINATVATSSTASITAAGGRITVNGAGGVNNGDVVSVGAGIFSVTNAAATYTNSNAAIVATTTVSTGTLSIQGNLSNAAGETMTVSSTGNITVGDTITYGGTITNNGTITLSTTGIVNANGTFTNSGTFTNTAGGQLNLRGATSTINGTFNRGTGTVTMNGGAAQNLSGTALTAPAVGLNNLTMNNANGVTLGNDVRAAGTITFTSGNINTAANKLIATANCATSVSRASGHVVGSFQKFVPAGGSTCNFEIGTGADYTPASLVFTGVGGAGGSLIGRIGTPLGDHPNIATSGLDSTKSVNRWWALTTTGVTGTALPAFTSYDATFTFINPGDLDAGANTANFEIERWDGGAWNNTTVGTRNPTDTTATGITALGECAIAEKIPVIPDPGDFNAFESSTAGGAITGRIYTKLVSTNFSLDVVAILSGAQHATFTNTVQVDLVTGSTGGLNCPGTPATIAGTTQNVNLTTGRGTTGNFNVANAYRDVRVRVRYPVASPTVTSCSTDNFSIRPTVFTVTTSTATGGTAASQTDTSGTPAIKTGANFNLTAASVAGYDGTPGIDNTKVVGTPTAGAIGGSFGAAPIGTGTADGNSFFYSEVGNFGLNADAVRDTGFTSVDQAGGDCVASSTSNTLSGGQYGCWVGSTAVPQTLGVSGFGRFIPDNFDVSYNAPVFGTVCGTFTYVGTAFSYTLTPQMTVTARKGTNNGLDNSATVNYAGAYMKFSNAAGTSLNQAPYDTQPGRYSRFDALGGGATPALDTAGLPATTADPTIGTFTNGVGTLTFGSGTGLLFTRSTTTPSAPFNADIALALNIVDTDAVAFAGNPASFGTASAGGGISFNNGKPMRFGRLTIRNANGSQFVPLPLQMETQYWNGSSFITNADDNCTAVATANIGLGNFKGNLDSGETTPTVPGGAFSKGRKTLTMSAPGKGNNGSVDLVVNLGTTTTIDSCLTWDTTTPTPTGANLSHLRGRWCGATHTKDPTARAAFGVYPGSEEVIFIRENF